MIRFLGLASGRGKLPAIVSESVASMKPQVEAARASYSSAPAFEARLSSESTTAFLHGFVLFLAAKHGVRSPELLWAATVETFDQVFGNHVSGSIISALRRTLHEGTADRWTNEGAGAARHFDRDQLTLLTSFLEGGAD